MNILMICLRAASYLDTANLKGVTSPCNDGINLFAHRGNLPILLTGGAVPEGTPFWCYFSRSDNGQLQNQLKVFLS
jgi:hypothetical protein